MKSNHLQTGFFILLAAVLLGCNDEFMERFPLDEISSARYWNKENDLVIYNNYLYALAQDDNNVPIMMGHHYTNTGGAAQAAFTWIDAYSDNYSWTEASRRQYPDIRTGKHIAGGAHYNGWLGWNFVRACNFGLDNFDRAPLLQSVKNKYIAEARLFRGWFFADKVTRFGDIPYFEHELNIDSEELFSERTPREEAMEGVLADLTFACEKLPADWGDGNAPGRLNRWCALLIKSRVCLFEGTWRKYHGGTNPNRWLQEAANAARDLMDNGPYRVHTTGRPDLDYNFNTSYLEGGVWNKADDLTGNKEVMYYRRYELGYKIHYESYIQRRMGASKSFVEDVLCSDGLPITLSTTLYKGDATFVDIFENRDPRLRQIVLHPDDVMKYQYTNQNNWWVPRLPGVTGNAINSNGTSPTGYHIIKMYDGRESSGYQNVNPAITLRFGEALLNYAEAMAELGTITQADLDMSINLLRDRVGMVHLTMNPPMDPRYANDGVSSLIVEIRRERRVELFKEGHRYNDLMRWKQGKKLEIKFMGIRWDDGNKALYDPDNRCTSKTSIVDGIPYIDVFKDSDWDNPVFNENKHYLWPIPLDELAKNPNLKQNPSWQ